MVTDRPRNGFVSYRGIHCGHRRTRRVRKPWILPDLPYVSFVCAAPQKHQFSDTITELRRPQESVSIPRPRARQPRPSSFHRNNENFSKHGLKERYRTSVDSVCGIENDLSMVLIILVMIMEFRHDTDRQHNPRSGTSTVLQCFRPQLKFAALSAHLGPRLCGKSVHEGPVPKHERRNPRLESGGKDGN